MENKNFFLLVVAALLFTGCANTRLFATWRPAAGGFDSGLRYSAEQRIRKGPVMGIVKGSYSQALKRKAEDGYQYGANAGARYYLNGFFAGAGYYWSGYKMEFASGAEWEKDGGNWTWSAGYEDGPWEVSVTGSPREKQTANHISWWTLKGEYKFWKGFILEVGWHRLGYEQSGHRNRDYWESVGIGYEF